MISVRRRSFLAAEEDVRRQSDTWSLILGPVQAVLLIMLRSLRFPLINQHLVGATFHNKDVLISFRREDELEVLIFISTESKFNPFVSNASLFNLFHSQKEVEHTCIIDLRMLNVFRPTWLIKSSHLQHDMEVKRRYCCLQLVLVT